MMKFTKQISWFFLIVCGLLVISGYGLSNDETLNEACQKLSTDSEYEYHVISGEVIKVEIQRYPAIPECDRKIADCNWVSDAVFFAVLKPLNGTDLRKEKNFLIYTKPEQWPELLKKQPYMKVGKNYMFCARQMGNAINFHKDQKMFRIDNLNMIQELNLGRFE